MPTEASSPTSDPLTDRGHHLGLVVRDVDWDSKRLLLVLLAVLVGSSCGTGNQPRVAVPPPVDQSAMLLPVGAKTDRGLQWYRDGSGDLPFTIDDADPDELTNQLIRHFELQGWQQRPTGRSARPTSFQEGWVHFCRRRRPSR